MKINDVFFFLKIFSKGRTLEKKLLRNHLLAVLVLISMVSISFLIITNIIKTQHDSSLLINQSGKQRMYTQRVLFYVSKYQSTLNQEYSQKIMKNLDELQVNNDALLRRLYNRNSISYFDKKLMHMFNAHDGIIERYKQLKEELLLMLLQEDYTINERMIEQHADELIVLYDQATLQFQKLSEEKIAEFLLIETSLYIISLITIFLEALLIFRPAIIEVYNKQTKLIKLNKNLSKKVKQKVSALRKQEQLLIQQSKLAEMGEMLSNISHQWKQPLMILSMQIDELENSVLQGNVDEEKLKEDIDNCFEQIRLMSTTIEDFKQFYMPDKEKKEFDVVKVVEDVIHMEKSALQDYSIEHQVECNEEKIAIKGYESQLKQVLLSLTNNAIEQIQLLMRQDKMSKGEGKIIYELRANDNMVYIHVQDNAGGIPKELITKIFKSYVSSKEESGGSGIGLYMAKTIIKKSFKGKLHAKNRQGGARFIIELPVLDYS